ncbi:IclR family transcriptional regulator [Halomarina pelagica]|uniref:IclR family transcriptional regulator n=1 Tax=Halomarina pelagica TaxID=2961599 RepID=UPI0020C24180|nr:IclR family transcriptional regulator [Halomarina sp. BND7]
MNEAKNPVKSVGTTIRIVHALRELDGAGVTEVADHLGLTKGTVHNHLATLEEHECVVRDGDVYRLGLLFFEVGEYVRSRKKIYEIGVPEIDRLAAETGEIANILVEEHGHGVYLHRAKGSQALTLDTGIGSRVNLHSTALGKAILAFLPEERVESIVDVQGLPASTAHTITDRDDLREELATIRERGYAYDMEERAEGIRCVAAPVTTNGGVAYGAVSIAGPTSRMKGERLESDVPELVERAANVISINLKYS